MQNGDETSTDKLAELRKQFMAEMEKEVESMELLSLEKTRELVHELRSHQIELELQNEELRQTQVRLQSIQQKFTNLYDFAPVGYLTISTNGKIIEANLTASMMLGVERTNLIKQPFSAFVVPEHQDTYYYFRKNLLRSQESLACELQLVKKDGSRFPALLQFSLNTDIDGTKGRYRIVISDITERVQAEEELNIATKRWMCTFDSIPDIITIQDKDMVIVQANKAAYDFFKESGKSIVGEKCYSLFRGSSEPCKCCPELSTLKNHKDYNEIIKHENLDKIFMVSSAPILDENKNTEYIVHIARDITAQRELEKQLNQSYKMDAIGTLAGGIAHDFNNILTIIIGFGELIRDRPSDESFVRQQIEQVLKAAGRSKFLVQQILAFSRQADYELIALKLQSLVKETLKLLRATIPATVKIVEDIQPQCGIVKADPTQINQVVMNLCTNAFQAMDEKGLLTVTLQEVHLDAGALRLQEGITPGPFVRLSVADTGCGIDQETLRSMYNPFFTTKEKGKGTGMGLSVVHGIVESHGGFIVVDTEPGQGTTFNVFFPVTEAEEFFEAGTESQPRHGKERILFVDDEEPLTKLAGRTLKSLGYVVTAETDSIKALEIFKSDPDQFDLVISDQSMPEMSGLELAAEILQRRPGMPIILCTGYSSKIPEADAKVEGISKFLPKPYDKKILSEAIRKVLDAEL